MVLSLIVVTVIAETCAPGDMSCCPWAVTPENVRALVDALGPDDPACPLETAETRHNHTILRWNASGTEVTATVMPRACAPESPWVGPHFAALPSEELGRLCPAVGERLEAAITGLSVGAPEPADDPVGSEAGTDASFLTEVLHLNLGQKLAVLAAVLAIAYSIAWRRRRREARRG